jgi:hypothetical protein
VTSKGGNDVIKRILSTILATLVVLSVVVAFPRQGDRAVAIVGDSIVTGAGAGIFPAGANFNGVQLAGGTFGLGAEIASTGTANGDLEAQFTGTSLIGLSQWITITGWITSATSNPDGSVTLSGTSTLDMGDGTAPAGGLALVASVGPAGITLTVGGTTLPTLPKSDGWVINE